MKVTVAKTPGSRAVAVDIVEGGTVLDALKAANMDGSLGDGFEVRVGFEPAQLSDVVSDNDIITLTAKVTGNASKKVVHIAVDGGGEAATFVLDKITNAKSIFSDTDIQAFILSESPDALGSLDLSSMNASIFGQNKDGAFKRAKDRPLNSGIFLSPASVFYCVVHKPEWENGSMEEGVDLYNAYFLEKSPKEDLDAATRSDAPQNSDEACDCDTCEECSCEECSCTDEACDYDTCEECSCKAEEDCVREAEKEPIYGEDVPKSIHVDVNDSTSLKEIAALLERIQDISKQTPGMEARVHLGVDVMLETRGLK